MVSVAQGDRHETPSFLRGPCHGQVSPVSTVRLRGRTRSRDVWAFAQILRPACSSQLHALQDPKGLWGFYTHTHTHTHTHTRARACSQSLLHTHTHIHTRARAPAVSLSRLPAKDLPTPIPVSVPSRLVLGGSLGGKSSQGLIPGTFCSKQTVNSDFPCPSSGHRCLPSDQLGGDWRKARAKMLLLLTLLSGQGRRGARFIVPHFIPVQAWASDWHPFPASKPSLQ